MHHVSTTRGCMVLIGISHAGFATLPPPALCVITFGRLVVMIFLFEESSLFWLGVALKRVQFVPCAKTRILKLYSFLFQEVYVQKHMWLLSNIHDNPSIAPFRTRTHVTKIVLAYQGTCTGVNFGEMDDL